MKFVLTIGIDNDDPDLLTNIAPFITLGEVKNSEVIIKAVWSPADEELFLKKLSQFVESKRHYKIINFSAIFYPSSTLPTLLLHITTTMMKNGRAFI